MEELLSLKWNNHRSTFLHILSILRDKQLYTDATLACDGRFYSVHRLVLSTCSDYFSAMFDKTTTCKNPIIVLKDIKCEDLEALLDYMYLGEVNVRQADLASLIKSAECLRVKGLAVPDDEPPKKSKENLKRSESGHSPPSKRKRRDEGQDGREDVRPKERSSPSRQKSPHSQSRLSHSSDNTSSRIPTLDGDKKNTDEAPLVKVEVIDSNDGNDMEDSFSMPNDGYKEEPDDSGDPGGDLGNDLHGFLQSTDSNMGDNSYGAFPGTSSYSPGDLSGWQGDGSNLNFPSNHNYGTNPDGSSQNTPGAVSFTNSLWKRKDMLHFMQPGDMSETQSTSSAGGMPSNIFPCVYCRKVFHFFSHLHRHLRTHTNERPFPCLLCSYAAKAKADLKKHMLFVHHKEDGGEIKDGLGGNQP